MKRILICLATAAVLCGCSVIDEVPTPETVVKEPLGPKIVKVGMTRDEVLSLYGEPLYKNYVKADEWEGEREEWYYKSVFGQLPVSADYLGEDLYLYFDGDNLTNIGNKPLGRDKKKEESEKSIK